MRPEPIHIEPDAWCEWCGDPLPEIEERHPRKRFCNRKCKESYRNDQRRERHLAKMAGRTCQQCGDTFDASHAAQKYCGLACREVAGKASARARYNRRKV